MYESNQETNGKQPSSPHSDSYQPQVMFFGLTNSPATFQAMMNHIFQKEIREGWLVVYMDDLLIATEDNLDFHKQCVRRSSRNY
jgi:hypothetical protein